MIQRFFLLLCVTWTAQAQPTPRPPDAKQVFALAHTPRWLRLLHYKSHWFRGFRSQISGPGFFFSPEGARDPEKELLATIAAFQNSNAAAISKLPQPPACAFPARFRFLQEELQLGLPEPKCDRFAEFLGRFHGADSLTLVFSTAYPNNPASMFGHTFLRVNSRAEPGRPKLDLLDYGLNYAAQVPPDENNFAFVWFGLTGGYAGTFSSLPYYAKVNEYNNSESRDLWEYDLSLSPEETWWVLANAWEVEVNGWTPYYFLDENCSYEILTLLEVAKPDWVLSDYAIHMIPGETVKKVTRIPGSVRAVKFRPSLFRRLIALGERLSAAERADFFSVIGGNGLGTASVSTLDTAAQYFFFRKQQQEGQLTEREAGLFRQVLAARAERRVPSPPEPAFDQGSRPDWGHHASRVSAGAGVERGTNAYGWFQELGFRFAYHDLLNHDVGFVPFSEVSFPGFLLRYFPEDRRLWLEKLQLLAIQSFSPWSWLGKPLSWKATLAYEVPGDLCAFCHVAHLDAGVGFSHSFFREQWLVYELAGIYADLGAPASRGWRAGPRLTLGLAGNATRNWKQQLEAGLQLDPRRATARKTIASALWSQSYFFSPEWEARLLAKTYFATTANAKSRNEIESQLNFYF